MPKIVVVGSGMFAMVSAKLLVLFVSVIFPPNWISGLRAMSGEEGLVLCTYIGAWELLRIIRVLAKQENGKIFIMLKIFSTDKEILAINLHRPSIAMLDSGKSFSRSLRPQRRGNGIFIDNAWRRCSRWQHPMSCLHAPVVLPWMIMPRIRWRIFGIYTVNAISLIPFRLWLLRACMWTLVPHARHNKIQPWWEKTIWCCRQSNFTIPFHPVRSPAYWALFMPMTSSKEILIT